MPRFLLSDLVSRFQKEVHGSSAPIGGTEAYSDSESADTAIGIHVSTPTPNHRVWTGVHRRGNRIIRRCLATFLVGRSLVTATNTKVMSAAPDQVTCARCWLIPKHTPSGSLEPPPITLTAR